MTDKVQKILEEVVRMHNLLPVMDGDNISVNYADRICTTLEMYIDSLQKESVPKILEDMLNAKSPAESLGISVEEHDKIINLCLYGKEPEMVDIDDLPKEEPVSDVLDEAAKIYARGEYDRKNPSSLSWQCKGCYSPLIYAFKAGAQWQKAKDESTTEDLEEYINELSKQFPEVSFAKLSRIAVRVAKWQKQKDDREIKIVRELLADFDKHCDEYHEAGFKHGQEALMKDAVVSLVTDVIIHNDGDEVKYSVVYPIGKRPFNKEDKVKVIVIKED